MARVLLIGIAPGAVDLSDPALPPGLTEQQIADGIASTLRNMRDRGWTAEFCAIHTDETVGATIEQSLATHYGVVVIGGGIRIPPNNLELLERVPNAVHRAAPAAAIAFNTRPENSGQAAERWLVR